MTRNQTPDQMPDQMIEELSRLLESDDAVGSGPAADDELSDLVHLAEGLRDLPTAVPSTEFRERLRGQLLTEAATMLPAAGTAERAADETTALERPAFGWRERFAHLRRSVSLALASALSATSIGVAGVGIASQSALPGDTLYGVKQGIESVRMAVASGDLETGRLHLAFARERLEEVSEGVDRLASDRLIDTLERMDDHSAVGANELLDVYEATGDTDVLRELARFIEDQRADLFALMDDLPVEVRPFAERSLELVRRIEVQATQMFMHGCEDCVDGDLPAIPRPGEAPARDTSTDVDGGSQDDGSQDGTDDSTTSDTELLDGAGGTLEELLEEETTLGPTGDVSDTVDELEGTVDDTTEQLEDPVDDTTEQLEDTVDDTTEELEDTADDTTEELEGTADDTTGTVEETVGDLLFE